MMPRLVLAAGSRSIIDFIYSFIVYNLAEDYHFFKAIRQSKASEICYKKL